MLRKNNAFSLLELIISVAILSAGLVSVLQAISFSARTTGLSADMITACLFTEDKMQELEFNERKGMVTKEPVVMEGQSGKFSWRYALNLDTELNLMRMDYEINWQRANRKERIGLNTYLKP